MKTFYVGVKAVIVQDGKVLLVRDNKRGRDFWDAPGGRIDDDETIVQTLDRELHEELPNITGYTVGDLLYAHRVQRDIHDGISLTLLFYRVDGVTFDGPPAISEEHTEARWILLQEAIETAADSVGAALQHLSNR